MDVTENGHLHTATSELEHGADRVGGERVVAGVRLDGVQGAGQVVVASRVVEHLEVGPPVVVRVRIDARALKAVALTARGADRYQQPVDVAWVAVTANQEQRLPDPLLVRQRDDEGAPPIEDDGTESHRRGLPRQVARAARRADSTRTTHHESARRRQGRHRLPVVQVLFAEAGCSSTLPSRRIMISVSGHTGPGTTTAGPEVTSTVTSPGVQP